MKIACVAEVPDDVGEAWLQHLRDFDTAHPGCHFQTLVIAPNMTTDEIESALDALTPPFPHRATLKRP